MWHGFDDTNDNDGDHYYVDDDDDNDDDVNDDDDDDDKIYTEAVSTASRSWCRTYKQDHNSGGEGSRCQTNF